MKQLALQIATLGPIGRILPAPGTFGSLVAVILGYFILSAGWFWLAIATLIALITGIWASSVYESYAQKKDASEVIIDEVAGQWSVLLVAPLSFEGFIAAFLLFRLFDIFKPFPINKADAIEGGIGVMADDMVAGFFAGVVLIALMLSGIITPIL
ncbi:MAG: phosphatidylglycerophosphatase A [Candidatus Puniceispirillaceae bacterium]